MNQTWLDEALADLDARGLRRTLRAPDGVDLSSNDYLGMSEHPAVREALVRALHDGIPTGATGSRLLSGEHPAWSALEERFAALQDVEAALCFGSGWAANTGLITALAGPDDLVISDALNHASLIDGVRLSGACKHIVPHGDVDAIAEALQTPGVRRRFVVVEAVYSMDGTRAPLEAIAALCEAHDAGLIVDEAHATGMWGPRGAGLTSVLSRRASLLATVHPCGKALGGAGAFVAGSRALRDWLIQRARPFVFSTALPPYVALGLDAALDVIAAEPALRRRPLALADAVRARLHAPASGRPPVDTGGSASAIVPVITGDPASALHLQTGLAARGWHARAIRPPTVPAGTSRVRLVLRAPLRDEQVEALAADVLELAAPA